jgi:hypothetical protein
MSVIDVEEACSKAGREGRGQRELDKKVITISSSITAFEVQKFC